MTSLKLRAGARSTTVATVIAISALMGGGMALADGGVSAGSNAPAAAPTKYGCVEAEQAAQEVTKATADKIAADKAVETTKTAYDNSPNETTKKAYEEALANQQAKNEALEEANEDYNEAKDCSELPTHGTELPGGTFPTNPSSGVDGVSETPGTPGTPGSNTPGTPSSGVDGVSETPGSNTPGTPGSGDSSVDTTPASGTDSGVAGESTTPYECVETTPSGENGTPGTPGTPGGEHGTPGTPGTPGNNSGGSSCAEANATPGAEVVAGRNPADVLLSASSQMLRWAVGIAGLILIALGAITVVARRKALMADGAQGSAKVGAIVATAVASAREQISRIGGKRG